LAWIEVSFLQFFCCECRDIAQIYDMSPLQLLRMFLQQDPTCRSASTQAGFAKLVGRSETMIRAIEKNRTPISRKLAKHISYLLGVDEDWLLQYPVTPGPIPTSEGGELRHTSSLRFTVNPLISSEKLDPKKLLRRQSEVQGDAAQVSESVSLEGESPPLNPSMAQMVDHLTEMVRSELTNFCQNPGGDATNPFTELFDWLLKRAETRGGSNLLPGSKPG
jgi:transcriptional regulator with XRE-family HTH domain